MDWLTLEEVVELQQQVIEHSGGIHGIRDRGGLESAVAQPQASFDGQLLYPTIIEQAAALGFSLINNHPFLDGNKRIGHAAMNVFLALNGFDIVTDVDNQEQMILGLAAGERTREQLVQWLYLHVKPWPMHQP